MKGRHVSSGSSTFGRDLVLMVVGIVLVGVLVFGGLSLLGDDGASTTAIPPPTSAVTTEPTTTPTVAASPTTTLTTTTTLAVRAPSDIRVLVLNSLGTAGLAAQVTDRLAALGYQTLPPDNYGPPIDQSRVWYREGFGGEALELAAQFPDALVERNEFEAEADIIVVLGASFPG